MTPIKNCALLYFLMFCAGLTACRKVKVSDAALNNSTKIVVVLGSSTAAGYGASSLDSSWVGRMKLRLKADNKNVKVIDLAVGGYTTYQVMPTNTPSAPGRPVCDTNANVTKALQYKPALVLINLPSNDVANGFSDDEIVYNFEIVTAILRNNNIPYILTGTQPRDFSDYGMRQRQKTLDSKLNLLYGPNINDYYAQLAAADLTILPQYAFTDGIHLNDKGHNIVFQAFMGHALFKQVLGY